ncbi:MAG: DUF368 domain-containing protein [Bacteroidota bacterium]
MKSIITLFLKGLAIGAANVIPGVSGGTIALVTGVYERLINSVKSIDLDALKLLTKGKFKEFWTHIDGTFLTAIFVGVGASLISIAKLLKVLLQNETYSIWVMAFFFGLILVSVWQVGKTVSKWNALSIMAFVIGTTAAVMLAFLNPGTPNAATYYLVLCGVVAICSMILPGLSGSFVLILMGNYKLIMVDAVSDFNMEILIPVAIGAGIGLLIFARVLAWVFKNYRDVTIASLTGFVLGSLLTIYPWKKAITEIIPRPGKEAKEVILGYEWYIPDFAQSETLIALGLVILGAVTIWAMEKFASDQQGQMEKAKA